MEGILKRLGFSKEEMTLLTLVYCDISEYIFIKVISIFEKFHCQNELIREIILNKKSIFLMDIDKLQYSLDAIISNGDKIEETIFDIL